MYGRVVVNSVTARLGVSLRRIAKHTVSPQRRYLQQLSTIPLKGRELTDFAFAFEYRGLPSYAISSLTAHSIDGVLLRSSKALPRAKKALSYLQTHDIPFILLTNSGGKPESERITELSQRLEIPLDESSFIQSHTPFTELVAGVEKQDGLRDKCILVTGGEGEKCRQVAEK